MAKVKFLQKKWQKIVAVVVAVAVVGGGGLTVYKITSASDNPTSTTTFTTTMAAKKTISTSISGSGTVADSSEYNLTSSNAGTIDTLLVKQGDTVTAGQKIAHITDANSSDNVIQKQSSLLSAQNALNSAESNLTALTITAPVAGKVKSLAVSSGDDISAIKGSLLVISTAGQMTASVGGQLTFGDTVTVNDATSGKSYSGTVTAAGAQSSTVTINSDDPELTDTLTVVDGGKTYTAGNLAFVSSKAVSSNSTSNKVTSVYVSENQIVSKGQNLLQLDTTNANQNVTIAKNNLTVAQEQLTSAQKAADNDTITSPVNGTVAVLDVKNGDSLQTGGAIATIIDPGAMQTVISVDENDITKVSVGQKADITLDAISGKTFTGSVAQINPIGTSSNGVTDYSVTVTIDNPTGVMVGMTTNASIITQSKADTLVIPSGAILEKNGSTGYVIDAAKVMQNGQTIKLNDITTRELVAKYGKQVSIGLATADQDEITAGVEQGEQLAIPFTINFAMLKSLSNSNSSGTSLFGSGRMGGNGGMGGFGGTGNLGGNGSYRRSTTGNAGGGNYGTGNNGNRG